jgi:hypothetical protein
MKPEMQMQSSANPQHQPQHWNEFDGVYIVEVVHQPISRTTPTA